MIDLKKENILPRVGRMEQLAEIRRTVLDDGKGRGMRAWEVTNASGLAFTVYPDKGLDIGPATFNGLPLTWMTRNGAVAPAFYDASGIEWLRTWAGGLLTSCGWLNVGPDCAGEGLHGRQDHIPAEDVNSRAYWDEKGDYVLEITGRIVHARVFGEYIVTNRTIRTRLGKSEIEILDETENRGPAPSPLMQLFHMNFGWPLVSEHSSLEAPEHTVTPQNPYCAEHLGEWSRFAAPVPNFPEQVFYHDLPTDADGFCTMKIVNPDTKLAVAVSFRKAELPYLIQWKMPGACEYVTGLEPSNCYPEGQTKNAERGILRTIAPGEVVKTCIRVSVSAM